MFNLKSNIIILVFIFFSLIILLEIKNIKIENFLNKNDNYDIRNIVDRIYIINRIKTLIE